MCGVEWRWTAARGQGRGGGGGGGGAAHPREYVDTNVFAMDANYTFRFGFEPDGVYPHGFALLEPAEKLFIVHASHECKRGLAVHSTELDKNLWYDVNIAYPGDYMPCLESVFRILKIPQIVFRVMPPSPTGGGNGGNGSVPPHVWRIPTIHTNSTPLPHKAVDPVVPREQRPVVLNPARRLSEAATRENSDMTRKVQWESVFRQPRIGDSQSSAFTGPEIADCAGDVPDTHCCRLRTTFWVSNDPNNARWFGNPGVTSCEQTCGDQFTRTGHDTQCVPVPPECNDWYGEDDPTFLYSELVLLEAYCICGMKLSAVALGARRLQYTGDGQDGQDGQSATEVAARAWKWPNAAVPNIDVVTGGHFKASDTCYKSSINFHATVFKEYERTCPTADGTSALYTEMSSDQIAFSRDAVHSPYPECAGAEGLDCCAVDRFDAMASHYYSRPSTWARPGPIARLADVWPRRALWSRPGIVEFGLHIRLQP